jgi:hypothetical protein
MNKMINGGTDLSKCHHNSHLESQGNNNIFNLRFNKFRQSMGGDTRPIPTALHV